MAGTAAAEIVTVGHSGSGDYTLIQDAIDNASSGDSIVVKPGIYTENLLVNKSVSIVSESGNPENVILKPFDTENNLITINAGNVTFSGFTVMEAYSSKAIFLYKASGCIIKNNVVKFNKYGIYLNNSDSNEILNNTLLSNTYIGLCLFESDNNYVASVSSTNDHIGFDLVSSCDNVLSGNTFQADGVYSIYFHQYSHDNLIVNNTIYDTYYFSPLGGYTVTLASMDSQPLAENNEFDMYNVEGANQDSGAITLSSTPGVYGGTGLFLNKHNTGNTIAGNEIVNSYLRGLSIYNGSSGNIIYNNYFNNTQNTHLLYDNANIWNISKTAGINVVGGPYIGGNFWANPDGTGFSQVSMDSDDDGICDGNYTIRGDNIDYLPLVSNEVLNPDSAKNLTLDHDNLVDSLEIRSPVYDNEDIASLGDGQNYIDINALNFAAFYYDLNRDVSTESMSIYDLTNEGNGTYRIEEHGVRYDTSVKQIPYRVDFATEESMSDNETYPAMGIFGDLYVPVENIENNSSCKAAKLLLDSDDKYTLRTNSPLELPEGYALTAKQIDVEGGKVWMEFSKDGEFIEDEVIDLTAGKATWDYDIDIGDQNDVIILRVLITDLFQGQVDNLAVVEGLWLIDIEDENILEIGYGDEFEELEVDYLDDGRISMSNPEGIIVKAGESTLVAPDISLNLSSSDNPCFYLKTDIDIPGTYELRGTVANSTQFSSGSVTWNYENFAGFVYDPEINRGTESLRIHDIYGNYILEEGLVYETALVQKEYAAVYDPENTYLNNMTYNYIGLFGEEYVSLFETDAGVLSRLVVDSNSEYILNTSSPLELPLNYEFMIQTMNEDNALVELSKNGNILFSENVDVSDGGYTWEYQTDIHANMFTLENVTVFRMNIKEVDQDTSGEDIVIDGLWLIDYDEIIQIDSDALIGEFEVYYVTDSIVMANIRGLVLEKGTDIELAEGFKFRVADDDTLRLYPFREYEVVDNDVNLKPVVSTINQSVESASSGTEVTLSGSGTDSDGLIVAYNWRSNIDSQLSTNASFTTSALSVGNHTIHFRVKDDDGAWSDEVSVSLVIETISSGTSTSGSSSSGSGGGGEGGGGGTTGELYENIAFKDVKSEFVTKDSVTSYDFTDEDNEVEYVQFTASRNWGKIPTTIECLHNTSALVDKEPQGTVYRNLNIWVGKSSFSKNIEDCVIGFKVSKEWLSENEVDKNTVRLLHYSDGEWEELDTKLVDEDDGYLHFEASTPGFSPFAIVGDSTRKALDLTDTTDSTGSANEDVASGDELEEPDSKSTPGFAGVVSMLAFLLAGYCMVYRKKS